MSLFQGESCSGSIGQFQHDNSEGPFSLDPPRLHLHEGCVPSRGNSAPFLRRQRFFAEQKTVGFHYHILYSNNIEKSAAKFKFSAVF